MSADDIQKAAVLFGPGGAARVALERLDRHFGTQCAIAEDPLLLPAHIQKSMAAQGYRSGAKGVYDTNSGQIYLIASNISTAKDAVMAYRHEVTGHLGVRRSLGADRDDVFRRVFESYEQDPRLESIAQTYRLDLAEPENQLLAAEELIAHLSESNDRPSLYDSIRLKAKEDYAATTGNGIEYTDDDIKVLLQRGRDYLVSSTQFEPGPEPALRSPAELNPRWSAINTLLTRQPADSMGAFDRWLVDSSGKDLNSLSSIFDNQYVMLEAYSRYLGSEGLHINEAGDLTVTRITTRTAEIVGADPVMAAPPSELQEPEGNGPSGFTTSIDNLQASPSGGIEIIDPLLAQPAWPSQTASLRFMYVGEDGGERLGRLESFQQASLLKAANQTSSQIWMQTGWFEGPDGVWRLEISDRDAVTSVDAKERIDAANASLATLPKQYRDGAISESELARKTAYYTQEIQRIESSFDQASPGLLPSFLSHPTLFEAYPELASMRVVLDPDAPYPEVTSGALRIVIPASYENDPELFRETLIHETQHIVQRIEGFSRGMSPFMNGYREQWEAELNDLLSSDPDVDLYMELQIEMFDGRLRVNQEQNREDMAIMEENSPSVIHMNELTQRLKLIEDPEAYTKAFGEIEANDSVDRLAMTEGQRRRIAPYSNTMPSDREVILHQFDDIPQAMFLGPVAAQSSTGQLSVAHDLELSGSSPVDIFEQTGWFRGVDTMWRFEIDDAKTTLNNDALSILEPSWETLERPRIASITYRRNPGSGFDVRLVPENAQKVADIVDLKGVSRSFLMMSLPGNVAAAIMKGEGAEDYYDFETDQPNGFNLKVDFVYDVPNTLPLNRLVDHPELFDQYPQLKDWNVVFHPVSDKFPNSTAMCDTQRKSIILFPSARRLMVPALLHEIQHAVQGIEGFAMGSSPNAPGVAAKIDNNQYHSEALRSLDLAPFAKASAEQWSAFFNKAPGVKKAELQWLGLDDYLGGFTGTIESAQVRSYIESQQLQVEESLSAPSPSRTATTLRKDIEKWMEDFSANAASQGADHDDVFVELNEMRSRIGWQLSNGATPPSASDNVLLAQLSEGMDERLSLENFEAQIQTITQLESLADGKKNETEYHQYVLEGGRDYRELLIKARQESISNQPGAQYQSNHWVDHPNVMAHARFQTFEQDNGQRVLLVEEIQSDWRVDTLGEGLSAHYHQDYLAALDELNALANNLNKAEQDFTDNKARVDEIGAMPNIKALHEGDIDTADLSPDELALSREYGARVDQLLSLLSKVDDLKYSMSRAEDAKSHAQRMTEAHARDFPLGKDWYAMVAKRLVRYAAENGFDAISWSPASVQAERSSSGNRQRLDDIQWSINESGEYEIKGHIEDELVIEESVAADKLEEHLTSSVVNKILANPQGRLEGPDLTFDARGFEQFYNQMLPKAMVKFIKPWNAKVEMSHLDGPEAPAGIQFPTIQINDAMRKDLSGSTTPMYMAQKADAMSAYFRSAGEVEARTVEATYRNPALKSVFPVDRYDVPADQQIVSWAQEIALKLGPNALGADVTSMRQAAEMAAEKALGVPEASEYVYQVLRGASDSPEAVSLRARCAELASDINPHLKEHTGWTIGDTGYLNFDLKAPDCRAQKSVVEVIAEDVRKLANDVQNDKINIPDITATYNAITTQAVPLSTLIGDHPILSAYPVLERAGVRQSVGVRETRWSASEGVITVPPHLSRMELGAYLTKGLNQAVASMEMLAEPSIKRDLGIGIPTTNAAIAKGIDRVIAQCNGRDTITQSMVSPAPAWLQADNATKLADMKVSDARKLSQMLKTNVKGVWLSPEPRPEALEIKAANELDASAAEPVDKKTRSPASRLSM
jgi:hypothetical protein